jgi:hypothetical protein
MRASEMPVFGIPNSLAAPIRSHARCFAAATTITICSWMGKDGAFFGGPLCRFCRL